MDVLEWARSENRTGVQPPETSDLVAFGQLLTMDAARTTSLQPLAKGCDRYCTGMVDECVARVALKFGAGAPTSYALEPVISADDYRRSERAVADLMSYLGYLIQRGDLIHDHVALPQCFIDYDGRMIKLREI